MKKLSFWVISMSTLCAVAAPSYSADMIEGYRTHPQHRHRHYVLAPASDCDVLRIDYRHPYEPHTDYVKLCTHPKRTIIVSRDGYY